MGYDIHEFYVISSKDDIIKYCNSKEEAQKKTANKLNKVLGYSCYTTDDRWI